MHKRRRRAGRVIGAVVLLAILGGVSLLWVRRAAARSALLTIDTSPVQPIEAAIDTGARRAIFSGDDAAVSIVDTQSGQLVRVLHVGVAGRPHTLAVSTHTGHTFVISQGSQSTGGLSPGASTVSMLDTRRGTLLRTVRSGLEATGGAVDERTGRVFVAFVGPTQANGSGGVSVLDARTGALLRITTVGLRPAALAVDTRAVHVLVLNGSGNSVSVLDARSGAVIRTVPVGRSPQAVAVDERTRRAFIANTGDGTVSVLDTRTGAVVGTVSVGLGNDAVAVDARSRHVFVTGIGTVSMLDATTGRLLRTITVGGSPYAIGVNAATGHAVVTGTDGGLWAAVHHVAPGQPPEWAGYASVLDTTSGALLYAVRVGQDPRGVAVDARSGRAFVANTWGSSVSVLDTTQQ